MRVATALLIAVFAPSLCAAQDLTPRAYLLLPVESNAVIVTYAFSDGGEAPSGGSGAGAPLRSTPPRRVRAPGPREPQQRVTSSTPGTSRR